MMKKFIVLYDLSGWDNLDFDIIGRVLQITLAMMIKNLKHDTDARLCMKLVDLRVPFYLFDFFYTQNHYENYKKNSLSVEDSMNFDNRQKKILSTTSSILRSEHRLSGQQKLVSHNSHEHEWLGHYIKQSDLKIKVSNVKHKMINLNMIFNSQVKSWSSCVAVNMAATLIGLCIPNFRTFIEEKSQIILFMDIPNTLDGLDTFLGTASPMTDDRLEILLAICSQRLSKCADILYKNGLDIIIVDTKFSYMGYLQEVYKIIRIGMSIQGQNCICLWRPQIIHLSSLHFWNPPIPSLNFLRIKTDDIKDSNSVMACILVIGQNIGSIRLILTPLFKHKILKSFDIILVTGKGQINGKIYLKNANEKFYTKFQVTLKAFALNNSSFHYVFSKYRYLRDDGLLFYKTKENSAFTKENLCNNIQELFKATITRASFDKKIYIIDSKNYTRFILPLKNTFKNGILFRPSINCKFKGKMSHISKIKTIDHLLVYDKMTNFELIKTLNLLNCFELNFESGNNTMTNCSLSSFNQAKLKKYNIVKFLGSNDSQGSNSKEETRFNDKLKAFKTEDEVLNSIKISEADRANLESSDYRSNSRIIKSLYSLTSICEETEMISECNHLSVLCTKIRYLSEKLLNQEYFYLYNFDSPWKFDQQNITIFSMALTQGLFSNYFLVSNSVSQMRKIRHSVMKTFNLTNPRNSAKFCNWWKNRRLKLINTKVLRIEESQKIIEFEALNWFFFNNQKRVINNSETHIHIGAKNKRNE